MVSPFETDLKWEAFLQYGKRQFFKNKTTVYHQGTFGDGFYYLHKGLAKVTITTVKGPDRLVNIVVPGQILGVQAMDGQTHFTTAVTARDSVLYHFSCEQFSELLRMEPELLKLFTQTVNQKMRILLYSIHSKALTAEEQIAALLLNICDEFSSYEVPLTQQDLANCTGLTRITVYKILKQWKEDGLIDIQRRKFVINCVDSLRNPNRYARATKIG